jgi:hypothetical protein
VEADTVAKKAVAAFAAARLTLARTVPLCAGNRRALDAYQSSA